MRKNITCYLITIVTLTIAQMALAQNMPGIPLGFKYAPAKNLPVISMPAINKDSLLAEDAVNEKFKGHPYRFGFNHLVYYKPDNSGTWTNLPNGDRIWQLDVKAQGAYSINLGFSGFHLAPGALLFVYSKDRAQVLGAYTSANNTPDNFFGTELIQGDEAVLEYYEPAALKGQSSFVLFRITQGYKDVANYLKSGTGFGASGICIHNINCPQYYDYSAQKRAVVCVVAGNEFCSGALINDALSDGTPYLLTANHCGTADGQWVFRFNWEAPGCEDPSTNPPFQTITGALPVAQSGVSDFNLIKLNSTPPCNYHAFYLGWNRSLTPATSVTNISHPLADIKKCSQADNPVTATAYDAGNGPAQVWQIGVWTDGATEPGSSGSPLLDQNKRLVGQLYGGPSDCDVPAYDKHDYFGRFSVSWDSGSTPQTRLKDWLDPNNSGAITNDGYDPCPPIDTIDIELNAVLAPINGSCGATISPAITITNIGTVSIDSITINYYIDGAEDSTYLWTGSLAQGAATNINLPPMPVSPGLHNFYANINLPARLIDQNLFNDSIISAFTIFPPTALAVPLVEGFEQTGFSLPGWTLTTPPSGITWQQTTPGGFGQSQYSVYVNEFEAANDNSGELAQLITPTLNLAHAPNPSFLKFDVAYRAYGPFNTDSLAVLSSVDCGNTWTRIYIKGGETLATDSDYDSLFIPTPNEWRKDSMDISSLVGQTEVLFQFEAISGWGNAIYLDNIDIADTNTSVGILPVPNDIALRVYPNPSAGYFNLQFSLNTAQNITAGVYSADGKKLISIMENDKIDAGLHQVEINTTNFSNGIYILKVNEHFVKLEKMK